MLIAPGNINDCYETTALKTRREPQSELDL
jgi:hypothetical protein